ncbi:MAG: restriction endonuclease subunit S [Oscillospiraceae bacterium]|jgi:type I restriction enzyme S subunit
MMEEKLHDRTEDRVQALESAAGGAGLMARGKKKETLTPEERLQAALVPEREQPYPVPGNWCWTYIKSGFDVTSSKRVHKEDWLLQGIPFYRTRELVKLSEAGYVDNELFISEKLYSSFAEEYGIPQNGDLLISGVGTIGIPYVINGNQKFYFKDGNIIWFKNRGIFHPKYVYFLYKSVFIDNQIHQMSSGTTVDTYTIINANFTIVPLPPLPEQQRIVDRIESLFAKLDEAKQKAQDALDSFETRKAAILHKAFTGELTAQWRKEHGVGMESWETHELIECFEIVSGIQKTPARSPKDNPIPYLAVANVYRDKIDLSDIRYFEVTPEELEKLKLQDKDILIVEGNGSGNEIGRCAMWHNELPLCIHQNHIIRMRSKTADVFPEYVLYYLNSQAGKATMQERAKTTAGLFNLSAGKVKTIPLPFASLPEQTEIVRILDDLLAKEQQAREAAEEVLEQIDLIKKAILARAFRGELGTNDPGEESAVELLKTRKSTGFSKIN